MKSLNHFILLAVVNQVCGTESTTPSNLGGKKQCLESPVKTIILATETFQFDSIAAMKLVANYDAGIVSKDLSPFPNVEGIEPANTEAIIKNGRYIDYTLKNGVSGAAYRFDLSICTYEALKTYINSGFTRVFQITEAEEVTCDVQADGKVKGRKFTSMLLSQRNEATDDDVPNATLTFKFDSDVYDIVRAEFPATEIEGVYDIALSISGTPNASNIVFSAALACSGDNVSSLQQADIKFVLDSDGSSVAITGLSYDADTKLYTATSSAAFATGKLSTDGVITATNIKYEAAPVAVTI